MNQFSLCQILARIPVSYTSEREPQLFFDFLPTSYSNFIVSTQKLFIMIDSNRFQIQKILLLSSHGKYNESWNRCAGSSYALCALADDPSIDPTLATSWEATGAKSHELVLLGLLDGLIRRDSSCNRYITRVIDISRDSTYVIS